MDAIRTVLFLLAGAALFGACAPVPRAPDTEPAEALLRDAAQAGGSEDPSAAYYLALAEREMARAHALSAHDPVGAASWARRAEADADVARLLAVEAAVRATARRTEDQATTLFREIEAHR